MHVKIKNTKNKETPGWGVVAKFKSNTPLISVPGKRAAGSVSPEYSLALGSLSPLSSRLGNRDQNSPVCEDSY